MIIERAALMNIAALPVLDGSSWFDLALIDIFRAVPSFISVGIFLD